MSKKKKSVDNNEETTDKVPEEDESLKDEKRVLKKQITELEDLISEIEFSLNLHKYGNIENVDKLKPPAPELQKSRKLKDLDHILQHELYKLSGLYCAKCAKHEYLFNFSPSSSRKSELLYSIQFFTHNDKGTIGKYIMPSSGILENILDETPIDKLNNLIPFFRNTKRHLECFADRKDQFEELKEVTSDIKNIRIDADMGYVLITCSFLQVYHKSSDSLLDMTVYLSYDYGKARPSTMSVDWSAKKKTSEDDTKSMRSFMKVFRSLSLVDSYRQIGEANHKDFSWSPTEVDPDEVLNINEVSEESEASEEEVSRSAGKRKAPRKRRRSPSPESREETPEDEPEEEVQPVKRKKRPPAKTKVQPEKMQKKKQKPEPFKKPKTKQTTLNFSKTSVKEITPVRKDPKKDLKTMTSTPMNRNQKGKGKNSPPGGLNISPIVADKKGKKKLGKGKTGPKKKK